MKKFASISTLLLAASAANSASALNLQGSDTLEKVVKKMIVDCHAATPTAGINSLVYIGGGSGAGQTAMAAATPTQLIAPMSREISGANCTGGAFPNMTQLEIAKDAIILVTAPVVLQEATAENNATQCDNLTEGLVLSYGNNANAEAGTNFASTLEGPATYTIVDWKDTLKLAYFGQHNAAAGNVLNTNSDARWALLNNIRNFSNVSGDCTGTLATAQAPASADARVTHLWRRDDISGTTDTFKTLIGVATNLAFANGTDEQDNDPIRRVCQASDQICGCDGKLGVVQAISVSAGVSQAANYPTTACGTGKVGLKAAPANATVPVCLLGSFTTNAAGAQTNRSYTSLFNSCIIPSVNGSTGAFNCVNTAANRPFLSGTCDGRVWNKEVRNDVTGAMIVAPDNNKALVNAVFRIRPECTEQSSTLQIGCLAKVYPNSIGFAGFEALQAPAGPVAYDVHNITPSYTNVVTNFGTATGYPIARKLFVNTLIGETALGASATADGIAQNALFQCFKSNTSALQAAVDAEHFFGLDDNADGVADYITNTGNICP